MKSSIIAERIRNVVLAINPSVLEDESESNTFIGRFSNDNRQLFLAIQNHLEELNNDLDEDLGVKFSILKKDDAEDDKYFRAYIQK